MNLLAGSLVGAWLGASWATRMLVATLYKVLAVLLVLIAAALAVNHLGPTSVAGPPRSGPAHRAPRARRRGRVSALVAALMGVAGGELLIPTIVLLYGLDIKIAGSLSLAARPADHVGRLRPLQPRRQLRRAPRQHPDSWSSWHSVPSLARSWAALLLGVIPDAGPDPRSSSCCCCCPRSRSGGTPNTGSVRSSTMLVPGPPASSKAPSRDAR